MGKHKTNLFFIMVQFQKITYLFNNKHSQGYAMFKITKVNIQFSSLFFAMVEDSFNMHHELLLLFNICDLRAD